MYKHVISDNNNIKKKEQRCTVAQCLYTNETSLYANEMNLVLFKLGCLKFKMLIAIPKVTTNNFKIYIKEGNQNGILKKLNQGFPGGRSG